MPYNRWNYFSPWVRSFKQLFNFVFNDQIFKQIHGCAMGSPVNSVVANLCMEIIEDTALTTTAMPPRIYKWYVDDCFAIIKKDFVSTFLFNLNSVDPSITFTLESENNGQIAFLDTLVLRNHGKILIDVYRKATHTDRYLDYTSHHEKNHKLSTAATLLHRASNLPNTEEGKRKKLNISQKH